jgi:hypothetical protein
VGRGWLLKTKAFTYECTDCDQQTSVTAGTIMHASRLPLTVWFWAAFLMATQSNGISALQMQNQLGLGSYRTAWMLCAKLRRAMVNPEREPLSGLVEADDHPVPHQERPNCHARGAQRGRQDLVAGAVEVDGGKPRCARLKVIESSGKHELSRLSCAIAPQTQLVTDDSPSYQDLPGVRHNTITLGPMAAHIALPWIHRLFQTSSAGAWASTTDCGKPTSSTTLMSSCSVSIGAGHGMRPSIPCSASAPTPPLPTTC